MQDGVNVKVNPNHLKSALMTHATKSAKKRKLVTTPPLYETDL